MSIQLTSTTDTPEQVQAALGNKTADSKVEEQKSASAPTEQDETVEESETSNTEGEESESQDSEQDTDEDDSQSKDDQKPKKNKGFKKRIAKLSNQLTERERELEYWKQEALKSKKSGEEPAAPKQESTQKADANSRPKEEDFETHSDYVEALTDWKVDQKEREREQKQKEAALKADFEKQQQSFNQRLEEFREKHDDFDERLENLDGIQMSIAVSDAIRSSDVGLEMLYELAKNRKEYERICSLPPIQAALALGKFEAKITGDKPSEETKKEVKTSKAPPPLRPVSAKSGNGSIKSFEEMSYREYKAAREKGLI